jgi:Type ISP C-terminal specificity domain/N-6 DNA Methylase
MIEIAREYHRTVHAAARGSVNGEEEAQLTTPVSNLFTALAAAAGLGQLALIRETRTGSTRPDFAALLTVNRRTMQKGYVELKAPSVSVDPTQWRGRNARQWEKMRDEADILIVCNGQEAQLYRSGIQQGPSATLPYDNPDSWDAAPLTAMLGRFFELQPAPITSIADLTNRLAVRTRDLRDRIEWLLDNGDDAQKREARGSFAAWRAHIYPDAKERDFADGVSQVIAYGMVLAALTPGDPDADGDGHINVTEARDAIREMSPVLAAAFAPLIDKPVLRRATEVEVGGLETLISAIDRERIATPDRRGDAWLRFYEDFLAVYDPEERREAGVYYTPVDAVSAMTAMTGHLLKHRLGMRLGFGDANVVTLDPATGTGTFPLAAIDHAARLAPNVRGPGGVQQAAANLARNLYAFELLPGPYAVAHLRLSQRLTQLSGEAHYAKVILTDTLEAPDERAISSIDLFGDQQVLAEEQERANRVKREQEVTVVIGNPPYRRVARDIQGRGSGGWVLDGVVEGREGEKSLFADILDVARAHTIFSHHASLYNLYVYFWRWALWKAFEARAEGPGIVSFITSSSWLAGPGFVGLRQLARQLSDEIWVLDLGGDNRGATPEDNIFAIETPVAIVTMVREGASDLTRPAQVNYLRVRGTSEAKLAALRGIAEADDPFAGQWLRAPDEWLDPLIPTTGDAAWEDMPLLTDLFPWQQPGCKFGRTWPIAPSSQLLERRWSRLVTSPATERQALFKAGSSGRTIETKVAGLTPIANATPETVRRPIVRYGFRSFDRQWAFDDPRLANLERPSLWQTATDRQMFFSSILTDVIGAGPAISVSTAVPDLHHFSGRGGKDIIPLYRDAAASQPNLAAGLSASIAILLGIDPPTIEDIAAYCYALLSANAYQQRFATALETAGLRVPISADPGLWMEAVAAGKDLLWLHTYAERMIDQSAGRTRRLPEVEGIGWDVAVTRIPEDTSEIGYEEESGTITVGDARVGGVRPEVWAYSVSGMQVLPKWLGYRTRKGTGRAVSSSSELDRIRPTEWHDEWNDELLDLVRILTITVDRQPDLANLLDRICEGELISEADLPKPTAEQRMPPATL